MPKAKKFFKKVTVQAKDAIKKGAGIVTEVFKEQVVEQMPDISHKIGRELERAGDKLPELETKIKKEINRGLKHGGDLVEKTTHALDVVSTKGALREARHEGTEALDTILENLKAIKDIAEEANPIFKSQKSTLEALQLTAHTQKDAVLIENLKRVRLESFSRLKGAFTNIELVQTKAETFKKEAEDARAAISSAPKETEYSVKSAKSLAKTALETLNDCVSKTKEALEEVTLHFKNLKELAELNKLDLDGIRKTLGDPSPLLVGEPLTSTSSRPVHTDYLPLKQRSPSL